MLASRFNPPLDLAPHVKADDSIWRSETKAAKGLHVLYFRPPLPHREEHRAWWKALLLKTQNGHVEQIRIGGNEDTTRVIHLSLEGNLDTLTQRITDDVEARQQATIRIDEESRPHVGRCGDTDDTVE
jgi:hypothetical protein